LDVRFLHDGDQRLLGRSPRLEQGWKIHAFAQLRNAKVDRTGACFPQAVSIAVAAVAAIGAALAVLGAAALFDLELHQPLGDVSQELADDVVLSPLLDELGKCDTDFGHSGVPRAEVACAKTTFAKGPDGRSLCYEGDPLVHHALGHDRIRINAIEGDVGPPPARSQRHESILARRA